MSRTAGSTAPYGQTLCGARGAPAPRAGCSTRLCRLALFPAAGHPQRPLGRPECFLLNINLCLYIYDTTGVHRLSAKVTAQDEHQPPRPAAVLSTVYWEEHRPEDELCGTGADA